MARITAVLLAAMHDCLRQECHAELGGCQNYGPFLGPYYNTAPNIWGTQKGTIILTTTQLSITGE